LGPPSKGSFIPNDEETSAERVALFACGVMF
jgi:hypothetical protein